MRLLRLLAKGLAFQNTELLSDQHNLYSENNSTTMRYLFYPPVPQNVKPGQIRCGEHSDYGSLTILFQDDAGGLQVISRNGDWIDAKPIPGAVIINIGELLQRWTTDQLVATKHRVVIPEEELKKKTTRRSLAYFVHPDDDVIIKCLDGSKKYDPVSAYDYLASKFSQTY
ncbi:hypothetical protein LSH36_9g16040 [Paralvinella palmiformis]|uniref:Fe2OG dioxygenase domain-containing protein n=1 Tax=Paralvinella palmiformis TaxID=53620 RepID=A0AAD9NGL8_9ANNE|nr:hypothetical protein LSH36_9g16040 [Paralvinella palmiformis]